MKKHVFFHKLLICIISIAMIFSLTSCAQQKKPIPTPTKSKEDENKPPKELEELSKAIEAIEKTLSEMYERSQKPLFIQQEEIKKQAQKEDKEKQKEEGGGGQEQSGAAGGEGDSGGSGEKQEQSKQPSEVELVTPEGKMLEPQIEMAQMKREVDRAVAQQFEDLSKDVLELHSLWNAYEAKAVSQLVMQASIVDFENSLNNLTKSIEASNTYQSALDAVQLYKYLPDFYLAYTSETPPEVGKIKFASKKISLLCSKSNYVSAKETLEYMSGVWILIRARLSQDNKDLVNQFEFAVNDLKDAIEAKNPMIVKAKTEVLLKIADEIEKAGKKKEEK